MQLRIVRLTIPEFLVTIAHLPLGSFLPVRRAEGNSLAKSIPVALCTLGPNIDFDLPVLRYRARVHAIPAGTVGWPPALISNATATMPLTFAMCCRHSVPKRRW